MLVCKIGSADDLTVYYDKLVHLQYISISILGKTASWLFPQYLDKVILIYARQTNVFSDLNFQINSL